ncbi:MAG: hypothetical protein KJ063_24670 [Anaerolineae bacterium]|nr:hypothetical protein [Anaerolineae bacterium]
MRWRDRIQLLIRTALNDLVGEEPYTPPGRMETVLAESQTRLKGLRQELDLSRAREKRAQIRYEQARAAAAAQQKKVDALAPGEDGYAAAFSSLLQAQQQADTAHAHYQEHTQATAQLRQVIESLQKQIEQVRRQDGSLTEQEEQLISLERLTHIQQAQRHSLNQAHQELDQEAETLARRKDRLSAQQDLEARRLRDDWE